MKIEEIKKDRINELHDLLAELAAHHNAVSADFKGDFPRRPIGDVLKNFAESLDEGRRENVLAVSLSVIRII